MKTDSAIRMDFQKNIRQAEELERVAGQMERLAEKELEGLLQELSTAWQGEAADLYRTKGMQLKSKISKNAGNVRRMAAAVRKVAGQTYDAEMQAYQLAQERSYRG